MGIVNRSRVIDGNVRVLTKRPDRYLKRPINLRSSNVPLFLESPNKLPDEITQLILEALFHVETFFLRGGERSIATYEPRQNAHLETLTQREMFPFGNVRPARCVARPIVNIRCTGETVFIDYILKQRIKLERRNDNAFFQIGTYEFETNVYPLVSFIREALFSIILSLLVGKDLGKNLVYNKDKVSTEVCTYFFVFCA